MPVPPRLVQLNEQLLAVESSEKHLVLALPLWQALPVRDQVFIHLLPGKGANTSERSRGVCGMYGAERINSWFHSPLQFSQLRSGR